MSFLLAFMPAQPGVLRDILAGIAGRSRPPIKEKDICMDVFSSFLY